MTASSPSTPTAVYCRAPSENTALFHATIGGLGITGLITWAEIQLRAIATRFIDAVREVLERISHADTEDTMGWPIACR